METNETMRSSHDESIAGIEKTQEAVIRDQKEAFICVFQVSKNIFFNIIINS